MRVAFLTIALVMVVGVLTVVWSTPRDTLIEIRTVGGLPVECVEGTAKAFPYAVVRCGHLVKESKCGFTSWVPASQRSRWSDCGIYPPAKTDAPPPGPSSIDEGRQPYGPHERSRPIVRSRREPTR